MPKKTQIIGRWIKSTGRIFLADWGRFRSWLMENRSSLAKRGSTSKDQLGLAGEKAAAKFLKRLGYKIIGHSHRQRLGEIDLIAVDGNCVVFVEVKTWRSDHSADPSEAVDRHKQQKLTRAALIYLKQKRLLDNPARFDVVSIVWPDEPFAKPRIRHFINAFDAHGVGQFFS